MSSSYDIALQRIAEILAASPQSNAIIEGHTDNSGEESHNLDLSTRRALAIKDVLVSVYGVPATRLGTLGVGSSAPLQIQYPPAVGELITEESKCGFCSQSLASARVRARIKRNKYWSRPWLAFLPTRKTHRRVRTNVTRHGTSILRDMTWWKYNKVALSGFRALKR